MAISCVRRGRMIFVVTAVLLCGVGLHAQEAHVVLSRNGQTIVLEPYAPNILRLTLSLKPEPALAPLIG